MTQLDKVLCYQLECRGFDSLCNGILINNVTVATEL
jgi:hypothetical protein